MTEVTNINTGIDISNMSKSEIRQFNKDVIELQNSIKNLERLQSELSSKIQVSDNSTMSTILAQIESTKQFAIETIKNGEVSKESTREILRKSYETTQKLLKENRKQNILTSDNQIKTLKDILNEIKEDNKQQTIETKKSKLTESSSSDILNAELIKGVKSTASLGSDVLSSTPIGMVISSAITPIKQVGGILKSLGKGTIGSVKSIGGFIGSLFNPFLGTKNAESLEKKERKKTEKYRKTVITKLDEMTDGIKKVSGSNDGIFSWIWDHKLLSGGVLASVATLFWRYFLGDEKKEQIKKFTSEIAKNLGDTLKNYFIDNFPKLAKYLGIEDNIKNANTINSASIVEDVPYTFGLIKHRVPTYQNVAKAVDSYINYPLDSGNYDILSYLKSKGYTDEEAAGIYGNIMQESQGDPEAVNKFGYRGLFQWDPKDRWPRLLEWAKLNGCDPKDFKTQIDYAIQEEGGKISPMSLHKLGITKGYNTAEDYTRYVRDYFERSGETDLDKGGYNRLKYAVQGMRLLSDSSNISSVDELSRTINSNQLTYDTNVQSDLLNLNNKNYQDMSQLFGGLNNSLNTGFNELSYSMKNMIQPQNNPTVDDIAMIALNSGSI